MSKKRIGKDNMNHSERKSPEAANTRNDELTGKTNNRSAPYEAKQGWFLGSKTIGKKSKGTEE